MDLFAPLIALLLVVGVVGIVAFVLYDAGRKRRERRDSERHALTVLNRFGKSILQAGVDESAIVHAFYDHASSLFPNADFEMILLDEDGDAKQFLPPQAQSNSWLLDHLDALRDLMARGIRSRLFRTLSADTLALEADPHSSRAARPERGRALLIPLVASKQRLGFLLAQSDRADRFTLQDGRILSILATQAAGALQNARSYHELRWRVQQLRTLAQVSRMIAEVPNLDVFLRAVVELLRANFGYYHVQIYLIDDQEPKYMSYRAGSGDAGRALAELQMRLRVGEEGIIGWVAANGEPLLVNDVSNEPRYLPEPRHILPHTRAEMAVPLKLEGRVLGVLDVQSDRLGELTDEDLFTTSALADQIAVAIEDARLTLAQREEAWVTSGLLRLSQALNPLFELDKVLATLVTLIPELVGVDAAAIYLWHPGSQMFEGSASAGLPRGAADLFRTLRLSADQFPLLDTIRQERGMVALDTITSLELVPERVRELIGEMEVIGLALESQGDFVGVLLLGMEKNLNPLSDRRQRLIEGITQLAAVSIQAALLFAAQQEEVAITRDLLNLAELLATSHYVSHALAEVATLTTSIAEVNRALIYLWNDDKQQLVAAASSGLPAEDHWRWWNHPLDLKREGLKTLLAAEEPTLLGEGQPDPAPALIAELLRSTTVVAVPLRTAAQFVGALFVDRAHPRPTLNTRRRAILLGIARQLSLALEHDRLQSEALENARRTQELAFARRVQSALLPDDSPDLTGYEVAGYWRPAREVAGDFYDYLRVNENRYAFLVADVADKGLGAALFMVLTRTALRESLWQTQAAGAALTRTNAVISRDVEGGMFLTLFLMVLDADTGEVQAANAGHLPPLIYRAADESLSMGMVRNMPMGIMPDTQYDQWHAHLQPGDMVVLVTDGITEVANRHGELFGARRLADVVYEYRMASARQLISEILDAIIVHAAGRVFEDDITIVVVRRRAETEPDDEQASE